MIHDGNPGILFLRLLNTAAAEQIYIFLFKTVCGHSIAFPSCHELRVSGRTFQEEGC